MIGEFMRRAKRVGLCTVLVGVWLSGLAGWLGTVATAPFVLGLCFYVWGQE